jgi:glycosyltransferase involved in cell wall biosynthesis
VNIGIFTESYKPYVNGVSVSVASFVKQLRRNGDTVYIFAPAMPGHVDDDPHVYRYPSVRFRSKWLQYEPDYTLALGRFPGLAWPLRHVFGATVYRLDQRAALDDLLRNLPLDVIHTQSPFAMGAEGRRWARRRRIPLVTTFHTLYTEYTHYTPFIPRWISLPNILRWTRMNCNAADIVIAPTEAARDVLRSWGVHQRVSILATGIDTARFRDGDGAKVRKAWDIPAGSLLLLYAGRVAPEKNIPLLLAALRRVMAQRPDAVLLFAGGGPDLDAVRARVSRGGLSDHVRFAGSVDREAMRDSYAASDLQTFPTETETQGKEQ